MKIKNIKKIKNLGIFSDYKWNSSELIDFQQHNIFYWWNWSWKTTLTKLFSWLETWWVSIFPDLEYEIELEDSSILKNWNTFSTKIRVFNQEYIENNIDIVWTKAKPIFILWEENKKLKEEIDANEIILTWLNKIYKEKTDLKEIKTKQKDKNFTDVAKIIWANTFWFSTRTYRKPEAERDFWLLTTKLLLDENKLQENWLILKQEQKEDISKLTYNINLENLYDEVISISEETIESIIIDRLKNNNDISEWVETGIELHNNHKSSNCEFCWQLLPKERIKTLLNHFNDADKILKEKTNQKISEISLKIDELNILEIPNKALFYEELQTEYFSKINGFNNEKKNLLLELTTLIKQLEEKRNKTTEKLNFSRTLKNTFSSSIISLNETIEKHQDKTKTFQVQKDQGYKNLVNHYLSEIYDDVKWLEKVISKIDSEIIKFNTEISELNTKISTDKATISSQHKASEILTNMLEIFLGRKELIFEVSPVGWYIIKRNWKLAKNLSEWEKTAIAFIHFTVHLQDQDFNKQTWIVVIDDPISSLDSNSLFQAFSFLKNSVEDSMQVFLFTHNFDFLRLLLNWLSNSYYREKSKPKPYYMINNWFNWTDRFAEIRKLDVLLCNHESEYHYLCKVLFEFETDWTLANVYHIPNIARKALETFLMFRVPSSDGLFQKLKTLTFDEFKKWAIYKFTNDQSHITWKWFDPSLIWETQKNVKYLLEMIESTFPEHFMILRETCIPT